MSLLTPWRMLRSMRKNPVILEGLIKDLTPAQARQYTDGSDGWSVVEIVCHLRDLEEVYYQRAQRMLHEEEPALAGFDQNEMARQGDYIKQDLRAVFADLVAKRRRFLLFFNELTAEQWQRTGIHPEAGKINLLEQAFQVGSHDIDHIEQLVRARQLSAGMFADIPFNLNPV